ncbi:YwiC-like family protein [Carboxydochorda subterranea]|uniref:YwiC-like family protein n=1 Tax=Carboxydichorda subterranea TaxID=3109565 RepID=A0ABZ1BWT0_9FIRM|nr:YwiC-like family protein [Limnochorda sp. L945t]WRP17261.1 YwiC-like family protein [Limnochorda sp. L945t]
MAVREALRAVLPREHGVWFMWLVPLALGAALSRFTWVHLLLLFAALAFHLGSSALLEAARGGRHRARLSTWAGGLAGLGVLLMGYPVWRWPVLMLFGGAAAALLAAQWALVRLQRERMLVSDALAIGGLQLWGPISYLVGGGTLDRTAWMLWTLTFAFFLGTAFHVRTLFRERGDVRYKWLSNGAHLALLAVPAALGVPEVGVAYVPSALRAWATPLGRKVRPVVAGVVEIANSVAFALLFLWLWRR